MPSLGYRFVNRVQMSAMLPGRLRNSLLRRLGVDVGPGAFVEAGTVFISGNVRLSSGAFINRDCLLDASAPIAIGADVHVGPRAMILTASHDVGPATRRANRAISRPVTIGAGSWIGAGAIILPGVTIAPGCVIAAGAVVAAATEPDGLYGGVPARRLRNLGKIETTPPA